MAEKFKFYLEKYLDIITYLIFGVLTTVVTFLIYTPCYYYLGLSGTLSNILSWIVAVAFAFLTNKPFVFKSHDWSMQVVLPELAKFLGCRIGSGVLETLIILIFVDLLCMNAVIWKFITQVMVVILNYIGSKLLVFKNRK